MGLIASISHLPKSRPLALFRNSQAHVRFSSGFSALGIGLGPLFEQQTLEVVRLIDGEEWPFSAVAVFAILTASPDAGAYWRKPKQRLNAEGGEAVKFCHGLKLKAPEGKPSPGMD